MKTFEAVTHSRLFDINSWRLYSATDTDEFEVMVL